MIPSPTHHGTNNLNSSRTEYSHYASGRVGVEGSHANWRLTGKDVPWIYSEIITTLNPDRSVNTRIRTSVNKTWYDNSPIIGLNNFNDLSVFKYGKFVLENGIFEGYYSPAATNHMSMNEQIKPFIDSVPYGTWPNPEIPPSIQP